VAKGSIFVGCALMMMLPVRLSLNKVQEKQYEELIRDIHKNKGVSASFDEKTRRTLDD